MAYQGHIVIPNEHEQAHTVIEQIQQSMADQFGGFSRYGGTGGWVSGGDVVTESHHRLVVDVSGGSDARRQLVEFLREQAEYVKEVLNEEAVLIEVQQIDMELI